ncbi:hypothetical protein F5H01DRAFT_359121, partial [Linnemannia elongata]
MDNKLQQKFALVQQMKKEKELKEASRVKDHRSVDIFALAGVNLPKPKSSLSTAVPTLTQSRQDSANKSNNSRHEPSVKRPRVQKVSGAGAGAGAGTGIETGVGVGPGAGMEKKLKRSSMAVRNAAASHLHGSNIGECSDKLVWPLFSCSSLSLMFVAYVTTRVLVVMAAIVVATCRRRRRCFYCCCCCCNDCHYGTIVIVAYYYWCFHDICWYCNVTTERTPKDMGVHAYTDMYELV